jgi:hypothetical protein
MVNIKFIVPIMMVQVRKPVSRLGPIEVVPIKYIKIYSCLKFQLAVTVSGRVLCMYDYRYHNATCQQYDDSFHNII